MEFIVQPSSSHFSNGRTQSSRATSPSRPVVTAGATGLAQSFSRESLAPAGAFTESRSPVVDHTQVLAGKTLRIFNSANQAMTASQLAALDRNGDGKLSGAELNGLNAWTDANEDGRGDIGELTTLSAALARAGLSGIHSSEFAYYVAGNAVYGGAAPASNYRTLRDTDNVYRIASGQTISFQPNQIKINNGNRSYLIGTDGNDRFDASYYAAFHGRYFDTNLLVNFLAGGGDDLMGGSSRSDNLWGGTGNDTLLGYEGDDRLYGEEGNDQLQGGAGRDLLDGGQGDDLLIGGDGDDQLYGESGNDRLFGGAGDDVLYGGAGDDILVGGVASDQSALAAGAADNNFLYGGAGNDVLIGGVGNDYLDGGSGADTMQGGKGDDIYVVNSAGDSILELSGEGYDRVNAAGSYVLNANIEELRLLEGGNSNATGNSLNNRLIGNSGDNILDGVTGADVMLGGQGNDTYYVDNAGDVVVELAGEGVDVVNSRVSCTLAANVENLTLLDYSKAQKGSVDGVATLVYGYPKAYELDYRQGDAVARYQGTCGLTSIANLITQSDRSLTEAQVVQRAIDNRWCITDNSVDDGSRGGTTIVDQRALLNSYGVRNGAFAGYNEQILSSLIKAGQGVLLAVNAGKLWSDNRYVGSGSVNHMVTLTGVACDASSGAINGFYIADSGRGLVSDMTRYLSLADFRNMANVTNAYSLYTVDAIKLREENINATGNASTNTLVGNRGNNIINGGLGNDTLVGLAGNDVYQFARGDGQDLVVDNDATAGNLDVLQLSGINQTNLWFKHVGDDLQINVMGSTDQISIKDWYQGGSSGKDNRIERIRTAEGFTMYDTDVERLVQAMAAFAPPAATQTSWSSGQTSNGKVLMTVTH
ncbi:hemolysin-type calcium binding protein [Herbaspirillum rubrisubalbicans M1]|nr:hemolysin-type calcium binding protein [Herbaspirillum rubrisubalbicans M1]